MSKYFKSFSLVILMFHRRNISEIIKKNLELLIGYPLYGISFLIPRNKNKWVIGSHIGFAGNSKFFLIESSVKNHNIIWISGVKGEVLRIRSLGFRAYQRWSILGLCHSLSAGIYIYSFHLIDINFWTSGQAKRVNLWHGVGIKNIEFKTSKASGSSIYDEGNILSRLYFPYIFRRPHTFLSTSSLMTEHFKKCFRIKEENCVEFLYPRCQIFNWSLAEQETFINRYESQESIDLVEELKQFSKTYLYMPTWRETRSDFISSAGFVFSLLNEVLVKQNELFLLKLHPGSNLSLKSIKEFSNIRIIDKNIDIYPILSFTSVLITDYSSIYYDYILLGGKDILLFPFDYKEYISHNRDLAFDYDQYTPGSRVYNFEDLLKFIEKGEYDMSYRSEIISLFWGEALSKENNSILKYIEEIN